MLIGKPNGFIYNLREEEKIGRFVLINLFISSNLLEIKISSRCYHSDLEYYHIGKIFISSFLLEKRIENHDAKMRIIFEMCKNEVKKSSIIGPELANLRIIPWIIEGKMLSLHNLFNITNFYDEQYL